MSAIQSPIRRVKQPRRRGRRKGTCPTAGCGEDTAPPAHFRGDEKRTVTCGTTFSGSPPSTKQKQNTLYDKWQKWEIPA